MYKDVIAKIEFHKERIINDFIKRGIYPTDETISAQINSINAGLSFFRSHKKLEGETFDTKEYNHMFNMIFMDLQLLYKLLYEISVKEYTTLKVFIDTHLDELETIANSYSTRAEQEINSTVLGKTIFFQSNGFFTNSRHVTTP